MNTTALRSLKSVRRTHTCDFGYNDVGYLILLFWPDNDAEGFVELRTDFTFSE